MVVVPHRPGPVIVLDGARAEGGRDDLDDLIDELLPDVAEGPGWFDVGLLLVGAGVLAWGVWRGPQILIVVGAITLAIGCVLPIRAAWRRAHERLATGRRAGLLAQGVALDVSTPAVADLVGAYEDLLRLTAGSGPSMEGQAVGAAHGALMEVATLLRGRPALSARELVYVEERTHAVAELDRALRQTSELPAPSDPTESDQPADVLLEAREELDRVSPFTSVTRIERLITEMRTDRRE